MAISRDIATAISVDEAAGEIVERLRRDTEMVRVWITLGDDAPPDATPLADAGRPAEGPWPEPWTLLRRPGDEAAEWARVSTATPVVRPPSEDVAGMVLYRIPIETDAWGFGSVWATRDIEDPRPGRGARRILAMAADQLGLALLREHLRDEVIQAEIDRESDRLKGALLDSVSHDLRTPLSSIRSIAGILMDPAAEPGPDERRELAAAIDQEAARLGELVRSLLDVSRVQAGALRPALELFELGELVDGTVARVPSLAGRHVEMALADDLPLVLVDAVMFDAALGNVLDNAVRYAPPPAPIRVTARAVGRPVAGSGPAQGRRPGHRAGGGGRWSGCPGGGAAAGVRAVPPRARGRRALPARPGRRHDDRARLHRSHGRDRGARFLRRSAASRSGWSSPRRRAPNRSPARTPSAPLGEPAAWVSRSSSSSRTTMSTRRALVANLSAHGYRVLEAGDAATALRRWGAGRPDLVVLDLGLPDMDGTGVIARIRRDATTPILVLSARDREEDKIRALEAGADDYVAKPFGVGELRARIAALLRRAAGPAADATGTVRVGPVTLDIARRLVTVHGEPLDLTPHEYELLKVMLSNPGRLITRGRLLRAVWGTAYTDEGHYLHVYVSRLRRKLAAADPSGMVKGIIVAEPGVGYRIGEPDRAVE